MARFCSALEKTRKSHQSRYRGVCAKTLRPDNFAVVYKHQGEDNAVMKVDKPPITPIEVNREGVSDLHRGFCKKAPRDIAPQFVDFQKVIKKSTLSKT
jgi:hypothetical protein